MKTTDDNKIKQMRKSLLPQINTARKKLNNVSIVIKNEAIMDAIPILFKAVDSTLRILLNFKQKSAANFQKNIESFKKEYKKEELLDEKTIISFQTLYEMSENYKRKIEFDYDEIAVKNIFEKVLLKKLFISTYRY